MRIRLPLEGYPSKITTYDLVFGAITLLLVGSVLPHHEALGALFEAAPLALKLLLFPVLAVVVIVAFAAGLGFFFGLIALLAGELNHDTVYGDDERGDR